MTPVSKVLALLIAVQATIAAAQVSSDWSTSPAVGLGPLLLRSQSAFNLLLLTPTSLPPTTLRRGELAIGMLEDWNNYFEVDPDGRFLIDAETLTSTVGVAYGVTDRLDVNASVPIGYRGGGTLDGFVEWFEARVGAINRDRRLYPRNQFLVRIHGEDGKTYQLSGAASGWAVYDTTVGARYQIARGSESAPAILVGFGVKVPTGRDDAFHSTHGADVEGGISLGKRLGRFHLYGSANLMHHATSELAGIRVRRTQWSVAPALEYRASPRTSYLLQGLVTSPSAEDFGDFARRTYEVAVGFKRVLSRDVLFEALVLENVLTFNNSADVGFHVGLVWRSPSKRE